MPPRNPGLLKLIQAKREMSWRPSLDEIRKGFRGWHQRGYIPHFDAPHVTQMVTFMLADSFPIQRRAEWEPFLREGHELEKRRKLEAWLDRGHGECWLRLPKVAQAVENILRQDNGRNYLLQAWMIMPNHVHLVVDIWETPLANLIKAWKGQSSRAANSLLKRQGAFWQEDYYDTIIRDADHLSKAIRYTENNPTKAKLALDPNSWNWGSARLRDEYGRLPEPVRGL